jgi:hypothetical protein
VSGADIRPALEVGAGAPCAHEGGFRGNLREDSNIAVCCANRKDDDSMALPANRLVPSPSATVSAAPALTTHVGWLQTVGIPIDRLDRI